MAYKAIVDFKDLQTGHDYVAGDVYPFEGEADEDRVKTLITPTAQRGSLIKEVVVVERKSRTSEDKAEKPTRKSKEKK